jgi:threonylcarbamoyladenosine tRNA methylthiotransferase MtaB
MVSSVVRGIVGKTFSVVVLGCRTNHYEAEALASMMERRGAILLKKTSAPADIVIILTCSVTSMADAKTRKMIRRARRLHPQAAVAACGCSVQEMSSSEAGQLGVDILVGNRMKHKLPDALENWFESVGEKDSAGRDGSGEIIDFREESLDKNSGWDELSLDRPRMRTRAFVKVQDGCSRGCSYCIVPSLRGGEVSRGVGDVVREVSGIVESGCAEVVLTGVHIGAYNDGGIRLAGLVDALSKVSGLCRLGIGSLEPFAVNDDLLDTLSNSSVFCPHLHLPVQSGDDGVLLRMRRGYDTSAFRGMIDKVRRALGDDVHISTDLIVGFPGETDGAFERSLGLLRDAGFGKVHVFPFSPRMGTDAAEMSGRIEPRIVKERAAMAGELADLLLSRYAKRWIGAPDAILCERCEATQNRFGTAVSGWTSHYLRAYAIKDGIDFEGKEILIEPKSEVGGILLGEGVTIDDLREFPSE